MTWADQAAGIGKMKNVYKRHHSEDPDVEGTCGMDASGSGYGPVTGSCEHGNEPSGSTKGGEFLD
jgi:hypothetical protein